VPTRAFVAGKLTAPTFIPQKVVTTPGEASLPEESIVPGGVPGGIPGGELGGVLGGVLGGTLKNVPAPAAPVVTLGPKKPVMVGGDVKPPKLIFGPEPRYPVLAKQSHISGMVVIEAIIDEHGNVTGMRAISGHPLLVPAAMEAVSKRKYEPTVLDGEPTPIDLRVEVSFSIAS
jgi:protein TonB